MESGLKERDQSGDLRIQECFVEGWPGHLGADFTISEMTLVIIDLTFW